jgi:hypothetical protein
MNSRASYNETFEWLNNSSLPKYVVPCQWLLYSFITTHFTVKPPWPLFVNGWNCVYVWMHHFVGCVYDPTFVLLMRRTDISCLRFAHCIQTPEKPECQAKGCLKISYKSDKVKTQYWSDVPGSLSCRIRLSRWWMSVSWLGRWRLKCSMKSFLPCHHVVTEWQLAGWCRWCPYWKMYYVG